MSSIVESMDQRIQIGIYDIGISIVNDLTREEMIYISLNKSKAIWTETKKTRVKPLSNDLNNQLEEKYQQHLREYEANPTDKQLLRKKYQTKDYSVSKFFFLSSIFQCFFLKKKDIIFNEDIAELITSKNRRKKAKRQALDGLWIEYAWSTSSSTLHIRLNRVQIDNQLEYTIFPVMLHPIISKAMESDYTEKPFIELSIYQSKTVQSNLMQFKYFKLLIQELAVKIDQGLIVAILAFLKRESVCLISVRFFSVRFFIR